MGHSGRLVMVDHDRIRVQDVCADYCRGERNVQDSRGMVVEVASLAVVACLVLAS
jgi:hypothetical protein